MISFSCNKCRKSHSRPESAAGTMIFCTCGNGVRVPWSSTITAEPLDAEPVPSRPARPAPRDDRDDRRPPRDWEDRGPSRDRERDERRPPRPIEDLPAPPRVPRIPRRVRANLCFNHDEDASADKCAVCKLPFCKNCLVTIQGATLCGPCKNFKFGSLGHAPRTLPLAILSLVVSLVSAPVMLALSLLALGLFLGENEASVAVALCLLGLALPGAGLWLSLRALSRIEAKPQYAGRGLAAGGVCTSLVGIVWTVSVIVLLLVRSSGV